MAKAKFYMPPVCFIVARSLGSGVIGCEGRLPWKLKTDLARFRSLTSRHAVIMGRKTYDSIGKPLPDRLNVVVSRSNVHIEAEIDLHGIETKLMHSKSAEDALFCSDIFTILNDSKRIFVIGGAEIYRRFNKRVDRVYLTEVHADLEGDAFFEQDFPDSDWKVHDRTHIKKSFLDEYDYDYSVYDRRTSASRLRTFSDIVAKKNENHLCMRNINNQDAKIIENYAMQHLESQNQGQMNFRFDEASV